MWTRRPTRALCGWALRMAGRGRGGVSELSFMLWKSHVVLKQKQEGLGLGFRGPDNQDLKPPASCGICYIVRASGAGEKGGGVTPGTVYVSLCHKCLP